MTLFAIGTTHRKNTATHEFLNKIFHQILPLVTSWTYALGR